MDRIKEIAPFIKPEVATNSNYSVLDGNDSEDDAQFHPSRPQPRRGRFLAFGLTFSLGALTMILAFTVWRLIFTQGTVMNRRLPEIREGSDAKTGLPLSWSHGDCGNSPEDALARGCRYSIVLHSWLPKNCLEDEDAEDELLMHKGRDWPYTLDSGTNLTMDQLRKGDYHHFTTTFDWHVTHCMYVWKRLHRIMMNGTRGLDSYTANFHHTNHCVKMIGGHPEGMKNSGTKIFVKYPVCA